MPGRKCFGKLLKPFIELATRQILLASQAGRAGMWFQRVERLPLPAHHSNLHCRRVKIFRSRDALHSVKVLCSSENWNTASGKGTGKGEGIKLTHDVWLQTSKYCARLSWASSLIGPYHQIYQWILMSLFTEEKVPARGS